MRLIFIQLMVGFVVFSRFQYPQLLEALGDTPVVLLNGARQVGKSTLAQEVMGETGAAYFTFDDATTLAAASGDPGGFVRGLPERVVLDEVQRVPELFLAIKAAVDRDRSSGRFLLTGSTNVLTLPRIADSLAGRMEILTLWPLSQGELSGSRECFIDLLFEPEATLPDLTVTDDDLVDRLLTGGYPEAVRREKRVRRRAWYEAYITTILQRDVQDLANIERLNELPRLLSLLAARSSALLNYAALARDAGLPQSTLKRYLSLLEATFLVHTLPAWSANLGKRLVKSPKLFLNDSGLTAHLLGVDAKRLLTDRKLFGGLLESFVVAELHKQRAWSETRPALYHFRTHAGLEVDVVMERADGRLVGLEVKAATTVGRGDFRGLRALQESVPDRFCRGVVLHFGERVVPFGDNLAAVPIGSLWAG